MISTAVHSIAAALGAPGQPAAEYTDAVKQATGGDMRVKPQFTTNEDGSITVVEENVLGIPAGTYYPEGHEIFMGDDADELPDEKALNKMKKADLIAQAEVEQLEGQFDDTMTNADLVAAILEARELDSE